jgi:hypothetical protein
VASLDDVFSVATVSRASLFGAKDRASGRLIASTENADETVCTARQATTERLVNAPPAT